MIVLVAASVLAMATVEAAQSWIALALMFVAVGVVTHKVYARLAPRGRRSSLSLGLLLSVAWLATVGATAVLAPWLPLGEHADTAATMEVSGFLSPDVFSSHPLGTNQFGLDILSRLVWGSRPTLAISLGAVALGVGLGSLFGAVGGYFAGPTERIIGIATNVGLAFPPLILLMIASPVVGRRTGPLAVIFAVLIIPGVVRLARANTLALSRKGFVLAAQSLGSGPQRVLLREILPNLAPTLFVYALLALPSVVVATASLSFLGLGLPQPSPTWGNMISEGLEGNFEEHPFIVLVPSFVLAFTILAFGTVGRAAQRLQDSRQSKI